MLVAIVTSLEPTTATQSILMGVHNEQGERLGPKHQIKVSTTFNQYLTEDRERFDRRSNLPEAPRATGKAGLETSLSRGDDHPRAHWPSLLDASSWVLTGVRLRAVVDCAQRSRHEPPTELSTSCEAFFNTAREICPSAVSFAS